MSATPRQHAKREALVEAAARVLRRDGLGGCTARAIAEESPLTKSALHYYFDDVDEIVDLAFRRLMDDYFARIEAAAEAESDPVQALWSAARAYLRLGGERPGKAPLLWFEVHLEASRRGELRSVREITDRGLAYFTRLSRRAGAEEPERRASTFFASLIGALVRQSAHALDTEAFLRDAALAMALPAPRPL